MLPDFSRTALLIGSDGLARLAGSSVLLAGVGGVGGYVAEALVRAGLGKLTLVDGDLIQPSNINRQIHTLDSTIGKPKVHVMAQRLLQINPSLVCNPIQTVLTPENLPKLVSAEYDLVLDAIDSFAAKLALLKHCHSLQIPVVASMGAAGRLDPTRVKLSDIAESNGCRLARKLRKELRRCGVASGIRVVYSDEQPRDDYLGQAESEGERRPLGSVSFLPATFGLFMAAEGVRLLLADS